jgi:hypothetical protein
MPVSVIVAHIGDPRLKERVTETVQQAFAHRDGQWQVSIVGSQANDNWEMKITGGNLFERSYTLFGTQGEHELHVIRERIEQMLPKEKR